MTYLYVVGAVLFVLVWAWILLCEHLAYADYIDNLMDERKKEAERASKLKEQIKAFENRRKVLRAIEKHQ